MGTPHTRASRAALPIPGIPQWSTYMHWYVVVHLGIGLLPQWRVTDVTPLEVEPYVVHVGPHHWSGSST